MQYDETFTGHCIRQAWVLILGSVLPGLLGGHKGIYLTLINVFKRS